MEAFDAQKIRKVLERVEKFLGKGELENESDLADDVWEVLQMQLRNCDVGTAEEQVERFKEYCQSNMQYYRDMFGTHEGAGGWDCRGDCPIVKMIDENDSLCDHCQLVWAQMPYEAEGGDK